MELSSKSSCYYWWHLLLFFYLGSRLLSRRSRPSRCRSWAISFNSRTWATSKSVAELRVNWESINDRKHGQATLTLKVNAALCLLVILFILLIKTCFQGKQPSRGVAPKQTDLFKLPLRVRGSDTMPVDEKTTRTGRHEPKSPHEANPDSGRVWCSTYSETIN